MNGSLAISLLSLVVAAGSLRVAWVARHEANLTGASQIQLTQRQLVLEERSSQPQLVGWLEDALRVDPEGVWLRLSLMNTGGVTAPAVYFTATVGPLELDRRQVSDLVPFSGPRHYGVLIPRHLVVDADADRCTVLFAGPLRITLHCRGADSRDATIPTWCGAGSTA